METHLETRIDAKRGLHAFAVLTAIATFFLIIAGGLVTSTDSGLAVPDWPLSYGMLMPPMVGGVRFEHGHRIVAGTVAILTFVLMLVLLRYEPRRWVKGLGIAAFGAIVLQAVLGGLTVIFLLPPAISVTHACLAQTFFCTTVTIALVTSRRWRLGAYTSAPTDDDGTAPTGFKAFSAAWPSVRPALRWLALSFVGAVYVQLVVGAVMRHTEAGLAIPDFPLAFGRLIPPQWSAQIAVHFAHRVWAVVVLVVGALLVLSVMRSRNRGNPETDRPWLETGASKPEERRGIDGLRLPAIAIGALLPIQIGLGALTVLSGKQVLPATAHVATGALILASGLVLGARLWRAPIEAAFARAANRRHAMTRIEASAS